MARPHRIPAGVPLRGLTAGVGTETTAGTGDSLSGGLVVTIGTGPEVFGSGRRTAACGAGGFKGSLAGAAPLLSLKIRSRSESVGRTLGLLIALATGSLSDLPAALLAPESPLLRSLFGSSPL